MKQAEIPYIASGVENDATTLANFWQFLVKFTFTKISRQFSPRYSSKINKNMCPHKDSYVNSKRLSTDEWFTQPVAYPHDEILAIKRMDFWYLQ